MRVLDAGYSCASYQHARTMDTDYMDRAIVTVPAPNKIPTSFLRVCGEIPSPDTL